MDRYVLGKHFVLAVMVSPEMARGGLDQAHFEGVIR
jgi:hypothetical protein